MDFEPEMNILFLDVLTIVISLVVNPSVDVELRYLGFFFHKDFKIRSLHSF